ncbi:MAG TPA: alpha/beta hydrolase [Casimicrobiaceae bacterium]|nr:alpha/beta hydrolase [Casimicrobiaceae bacterium]
MAQRDHVRLSDLDGLRRLAIEATLGIADLVEAMHRTITDAPFVVGRARSGRTRGVTGLIYKSVRGVTRVVGLGTDAIFGSLAPFARDASSSRQREAVLAALNGVLGDHLAETGNPLAIAMSVRKAGVPIAIARADLAAAYAQPARKVAIFVHGLCMNDLAWSRDGHDHGAALARDLGFTPVYIHYNTGRPIVANGRELDALLESLVREWPARIDRLVIVGHSMGGLVARSACDHASRLGHAWVEQLDSLVFLGTPHLGAPLERAGAWVDYLIAVSPYSAPFARLGQLRSAGIKDLRHGRASDTGQPLPLPHGIRCYAIAASAHRLRGDGLVPVRSAHGLALPAARRWVASGTGHLELLSSPAVYTRMKAWLARPRRR